MWEIEGQASPGIELYYDIPIGDIYFTPTFNYVSQENSIFSVGPTIRFGLLSNQDLDIFGAVGFSFMTWEDNVSGSLPITLSLAQSIIPEVQLSAGLTYTPYVFFGGEMSQYFGVLLGLRFPVNAR